jgi:ankyrin repeat protein
LAALLLIELREAFGLNLDTILAGFPGDLFGVYSRFLKRVQRPTTVFYVSAVLRWLAFSSDPVTMPELEDALAFDFSRTSEFVYDPTRRGENADRVCKMLEGMIVVKKNWWNSTRTVSFAHASVEDYLRSEKFTQEYTAYELRTGPSHRFLAQTCLCYLLQFANRSLIHKTRTDYPLGPYAAENWYYHLGQSDNPVLLSSLVVRLLQDGSNQYAAFNNFRLDFQILFPSIFQHPPTKPLDVCSKLGYTEAVCFLLQNGVDPNTNGNGSTALQEASRFGHLDIVHILLQSGAQVDTVALDQASIQSRWDIVQALLQKSSFSVAHKWISHGLAIAFQGGLEIVQILLEAWTNLGGAQVPHHLVVSASERGLSDIVCLLLEHGADVNAATEEYNALGAAVALHHGCVNIVRVLLEKGAEVNATSKIYGSALQVASHRGDIETVRLLVKHGAEVNTAGGKYGSPLQAASRGGNVEMVQLLLEHGANVNATDGMHGSALQAASANGHVAVVRLLLEKDADVNAIGGPSGTALKAAARLDQLRGKNWWDAKEITRILLENGAHEEDMTYGSEEDVDTHNSFSDLYSWSNAAAVSDNEDAMLDSSSDDSPPNESGD